MGNASIDDTHLKEKALHIAAHLGAANFSASIDWIDRLRGNTTLFTELYQERAGVFIQKPKNNQLLLETDGYDLCDMMRQVCVSM